MLEDILSASGIVGTLGGVWLGHWLGEQASRRHERERDDKQRRSVRALLRIEIDQNLAALAAFWSQITEGADTPPDPFFDAMNLAPRLVERPLPAWSRLMWETQAPLLAAALA